VSASSLLTSDQREIRDVAAAVADDHFAPCAQQWDRDRTPLPPEERERLAELDFLGITLPEEVGGQGRPLLDALVAIEEIAKRAPSAAFPVFEANAGPARHIALLGTDDQRARFLPPVIRGEKTIAVAISEPDAGSAATDLRTSAVYDGDEVVINGTKRWCTGGGHAEQYLVYVRFPQPDGSSRIGAVVVDRDQPGLTFGERERLMGFRTIPSADMFFDDVRVPRENVIVDEGGFGRLFGAFSIERLGNATMSLAIGQACLERTAAYVQERRQFGRQIVDFQSVHMAIADMVIKVERARLLIHRAAENAGTGLPDPLEASIAKCNANEMAKEVSDMAIQLHGGYGYSEEYDIERMHRDAHGWALAGGTPNMQRIRIASEYLGRRFDQRATPAGVAR